MRYDNLHELISKSSGTRKYFLSLPFETQTRLYEHGSSIHSAAELHLRLSQLENYSRSLTLSESMSFGKNI